MFLYEEDILIMRKSKKIILICIVFAVLLLMTTTAFAVVKPCIVGTLCSKCGIGNVQTIIAKKTIDTQPTFHETHEDTIVHTTIYYTEKCENCRNENTWKEEFTDILCPYEG